MEPNPSSKLEAALEGPEVFQQDLVLIGAPYYNVKSLPCLNTHLEHLRYFKYEIISGKVCYSTIQEFQDPHDAQRHYKTQMKYDAHFLIRPVDFGMLGNKHVLIFPVVFRDFNGCWVNIHTNGSDLSRVKDDEIWNMFKKIGKNMKYLSSEAESHRPHGNLTDGIGITLNLDAMFYNLGDSTDPMIYLKDVTALYEMLKSVRAKLQDAIIIRFVEKWMNYLSDTSLVVKPQFTTLLGSSIHPLFNNPDHVRMIFNYPTSWNSDEELRFLANMHRLCTEKDIVNSANLLHKNPDFEDHLITCGYFRWNLCFTSGKNKSALNEVYQFRAGRYMYNFGRVLNIPTIVIFAHNCIKHHSRSAQNYNKKNKCQRGHPGYMLPLREGSEILAEIHKEFPHLIENIFQAFYRALAKGYRHPRFSVAQILTEAL